MNKPRIIKDFDKISESILEQIKIAYPFGFESELIIFKNQHGKFISGLPFETEDYYYLIRMTKGEAQQIIEDDEDYNEEGNLKEDILEELNEKYDEE